MRLIPVIDVKGGVAVRAVGGRRSEYRPVVSRLVASSEPLAVARAMLAATGATELYVADLDAIETACRPHTPCAIDVTIWLDAGFRTEADIAAVLQVENLIPVIGSETWGTAPPPLGSGVISIDLRDGRLIGAPDLDPRQFIASQIAAGFRTVILLDLARVGTYAGTGTDALAAWVKTEYRRVELLVGGGIRNRDDVNRLAELGVDGVLVASAIHDGALP